MGLLDNFIPVQRTGEGSYLKQQFPSLYGALAGLLGTAPDEMGGTVLDPNTLAAKKAAEYTYIPGLLASVAPVGKGAGVLAGIAGMTKAAKGEEALSAILNAKKFVYPQEKALLTAQRNAAKPISEGGLGLRPDNTPMDRAQALGFNIDYNHGTQRLDRLLEKKAFDPKRATSGPMPYGTDDVNIASNYATGKADTSRIATDEGDIRNYFQVSPKDIGLSGRSPLSVEQSWHFLPADQKQQILANAKRVGYQDIDQASGPFTLHPEGVDASLSGNHFDYLMKQHKNNPLAALREMWHDGGDLVDSPEELANIFQLAGYKAPISQSNAPWFTAKGVFDGKARITSPLDTKNANELMGKVVPALKEAFKNDRTRLKQYGSDAWDKNTVYTPKQWVAQLEKDVPAGYNSSAWTSIPDKVTDQLKALGYDGILDTGGKMGGIGHQVVIPFAPNQIRSRFAAFDPARINEPDLLAGAIPFGLLYQNYDNR